MNGDLYIAYCIQYTAYIAYILQYTILYYTILYYTILYYTILYHTYAVVAFVQFSARALDLPQAGRLGVVRETQEHLPGKGVVDRLLPRQHHQQRDLNAS